MFECDVRLCCDWLLKVDVCFCFAAFVGDWRLNLMRGYVVTGYVKLVCVFRVAVFVEDEYLNVMLCYVVIGYVKIVVCVSPY